MPLANRELAIILKLVADQFRGEIKRSGSSLGGLINTFTVWKIAVTAAGGALFALTKRIADQTEELSNHAARTGLSVTALSELQFAAEQNNVSFQGLITSIQRLNRRVAEAREGNETYKDALELVQRASGQTIDTNQNAEQVFLQVADAISQIPDQGQKTLATFKLFDTEGATLLRFFNQGRDGIEALRAEARRLGVSIDEEAVASAQRFNASLGRLTAQMRGGAIVAANELLPVMTDVTTGMSDLFSVAGGVGNVFRFIRFIWLETTEAATKLTARVAGMAQVLGATFDVFEVGLEGTAERIRQIDQDIAGTIAEIERGFGEKKQLVFEPQVRVPTAPETAGVPGLPSKKQLEKAAKEQEELGKALVEMWTGHFKLLEDLRQKDADEQERLGREIIERTQSELQIRQSLRQQDLDDEVTKARIALELARRHSADKVGIARAEVELIQAQRERDLANEELTQNERRLIIEQANSRILELSRTSGSTLESFIKDAKDVTGQLEQAAVEAFRGAEDALFEFTETGKLNFQDFANSIIQDLQRIALRRAIVAGIEAGLGAAGFGGLGGLGGAAGAGATPGLESFLLAKGGIMPVRRFQSGGVTRSPQVAVFGEGSQPEAFVPLPDGRTIPVTVEGQAGQPRELVVNLTIVNEVEGGGSGAGGAGNVTRNQPEFNDEVIINRIAAAILNGSTLRRTIRKGIR